MKRSCWNEIKHCRGHQSPVEEVLSADMIASVAPPIDGSLLSVPYQPQLKQQQPQFAQSAMSWIGGGGMRQHHSGVTNSHTSNANNINSSNVLPEDIIAGEFQQLTITAREQVYEEIHGVKKQNDETPQFIEECMAKMERELKKLSKTHKAYTRALFLNRSYVKSVDFELMFLRSESYNPSRAAKRMVYHFQKKLELFGHEKLTKDIRWNDLDCETIRSLESGMHCFYPSIKDSTGRVLSFQSYAMRPAFDPTNICHARAAWYRFMATLRADEETQKKGIVAVAFSHGTTVQDIIDGLKFHGQNVWIGDALPFRVAGIHLCMESEVLRPFFTTAMRFSPTEFRLRTKLHYCSFLEACYRLATFGVPVHNIPVDSDGHFHMDTLHSCLYKLKELDDEHDRMDQILKADRIVEISESDVLMGRGLPFQSFPGTVAMTNIIRECKEHHDKCDRTAKYSISESIVQRIKQKGGRFLERNSTNQEWVLVADNVCRDRVAMSFRNMTRRKKMSKERNT